MKENNSTNMCSFSLIMEYRGSKYYTDENYHNFIEINGLMLIASFATEEAGYAFEAVKFAQKALFF